MPELDPNSNPLSRVELLRLAQGLGVVDADVMTRAELRAAIDKAQRPERPALEQHPVTWVSVARRLLASVVERGLNLPDAAALIRGDAKLMAPPVAPPPVATVTLARIYAAQGHLDRAIATLDEVLESDPDHELARDLRTQLDLRRAELAEREGALAPAPSPQDDEAEAARASHGNGVASSEPAPAPFAEASPRAPLEDDALTAEPPPVASVDAAAELVAPSFDTVERQAAHADFSPFPTEPPTLVGAVPLDLEFAGAPDAAESEARATLAAGMDWQIANGSAASTELIPEADAPVWVSDSRDAAPSGDAGVAEAAASEAAASEAVLASGLVEASTTSAAAAAAADAGAAAEAVAAADAGARAGEGLAPDAGEPAPSGRDASSPLAPPSALSSRATNGVAKGVAPVPAIPEAAAMPPALPRVPGLLLIETDTPIRYIYWELAAAGSPHWIHVVTHTPTGRGDTERRERCFPVHRQLGALRLEGVPRQAVVRAMLTHAPDDVRPLVVAGAVRPRPLESGDSFEVRYAPYGKAAPEALAGRARPLLDRANPVYWD